MQLIKDKVQNSRNYQRIHSPISLHIGPSIDALLMITSQQVKYGIVVGIRFKAGTTSNTIQAAKFRRSIVYSAGGMLIETACSDSQ